MILLDANWCATAGQAAPPQVAVHDAGSVPLCLLLTRHCHRGTAVAQANACTIACFDGCVQLSRCLICHIFLTHSTN